MAEDAWAPFADRFVDCHYGSLRGRVRTHVIDCHLRDHLPPPPAKLVDIGGGAGHQSLPLARAGYEITVVDPSEAMLKRGRALVAQEPPDVRRRIRFVQATAQESANLLGRACFAGVLCHGVVMYMDDPQPLVAALADLAQPGGVVSIVAKNADSLAVRPALDGDWEMALRSFDAHRQVNGLGIDTRADSLADLTQMLDGLGIERIAWYGVRLFTDGWTRDPPETDPEPAILAVELEASRRDPYRLMSRLFHVVGVRR